MPSKFFGKIGRARIFQKNRHANLRPSFYTAVPVFFSNFNILFSLFISGTVFDVCNGTGSFENKTTFLYLSKHFKERGQKNTFFCWNFETIFLDQFYDEICAKCFKIFWTGRFTNSLQLKFRGNFLAEIFRIFLSPDFETKFLKDIFTRNFQEICGRKFDKNFLPQYFCIL